MEPLLAIIGLAVSIATLIPFFFGKDAQTTRIRTLIILSIVGLTLAGLSVGTLWQRSQERARIEQTKADILLKLKDGHAMSFEQIFGALNYIDYAIASPAIDELVAEHRVRDAVLNVTSEGKRNYTVRIYSLADVPIQ